ncbi:MAG: hypothetical protein FWB78_12415 [Treponema sp.]|nr:hypothetical protein [Treponema sp.]
MTKDEKLSKVVRDFSILPEEKQDLVLGILQALVFAVDGRTENATAGVCHEEADGNIQK